MSRTCYSKGGKRCPGGYHIKGTKEEDSKSSSTPNGSHEREKNKENKNKNNKNKNNVDDIERKAREDYLKASKNLNKTSETNLDEDQAKAVESFFGDLIQRQVVRYLTGIINTGPQSHRPVHGIATGSEHSQGMFLGNILASLLTK